MTSQERQIIELEAQVEQYKRMYIWYRDTYENRNVLGVLKDVLFKRFKPKKMKAITTPVRAIGKMDNSTAIRTQIMKKIDKSSFFSTHTMDEKLLKIGIFIHLFYQDLWPEVNEYLSKLGINFDLFITLNEDDPHCGQTIEKIKKEFPSAIILKVPNKGLDVGPFIELVKYAISKNLSYDYILKVHTKKSVGVNAEVGEWWRKKSFESLMGSFTVVSHILRLFLSRPSLGMIGPYETRMSVSPNDIATGENANSKNIKIMANKLDIKDQSLDFFGGTMFWMKWSILEDKFRGRNISIHDFEPGYKKDELLSHAMERLLASMVRDSGHTLYEMNKVNDYLFYKSTRKKICWVHPGYGIGGGNRVIFDICQEQMKNYDVYSISFMGGQFTNWMKLNHNVMLFSSMDEARYFIDTLKVDYVFATGWQTVDFVKSLTTVEKKFYFIQDYEPWFADSDGAKTTYSNTFNANIVIANWLKTKLKQDHNLQTTFTKIGTSTNSESLVSEAPAEVKKLLFYFKLRNHHGRGADLIEALLKKLVNHKEFELNVIGHEDPQIDGVIYHAELYKQALVDLYKSNHVYIDLSRHRGIATIALEVAQYGVVSFLSEKNYGLTEYGFDDAKNCVFVNSVDDAYEKICALAKNPQKYKALREGVLDLSASFKYKYTVNDFNQIVDIIN